MWGAMKWSPDSKYIAKSDEDLMSVYELPSMSLAKVRKKKIKPRKIKQKKRNAKKEIFFFIIGCQRNQMQH